jgi:hypothetical protein
MATVCHHYPYVSAREGGMSVETKDDKKPQIKTLFTKTLLRGYRA